MLPTLGSLLLQLLAFYLGGVVCLTFSTMAFREQIETLAEMSGRPAALIALLVGARWPLMVLDVLRNASASDPGLRRSLDHALHSTIATEKLRHAEIEMRKASAMYQHVEAAATRFDRAHSDIQALVEAHDLEAAAALYADADLLEAVGARDLVLQSLLRGIESDDHELLRSTAAQAAFLLSSTPARPEVVPMPSVEAAS